MNEGEVPPVPQATGLLEKITRFANENANDPDIAALLPVDETVFEVTLAESGWFLRGDMNRSGVWLVVAEHYNHDSLKFPLSGNLTRDEAIQSASHHLRAVTDPEPRDLTATELRRLAIAASNSSTVTDVANVAIEYLRLSAQNPNLPHSFLERPEMRDLVVRALFHCWKNSPLAKGYMDSGEEQNAIAAYISARDFVTVSTFVEAFDDFKSERNRGLGSWRRNGRTLNLSRKRKSKPCPTRRSRRT